MTHFFYVTPNQEIVSYCGHQGQICQVSHLLSRASMPLFTSCTLADFISLLQPSGVPITSPYAVIFGHSNIVSSTVAAMPRNKNVMITQHYSYTTNLSDIVWFIYSLPAWERLTSITQVKTAQFVVLDISKTEFVQESWLKPSAVAVDIGTNYIPGKLVYIVVSLAMSTLPPLLTSPHTLSPSQEVSAP